MQKVFEKACHNGDAKLVQELLAHPDVDPTNSDNFPLRLAVHYNYGDLARALLTDPRVGVYGTEGRKMVRFAAWSGRWGVLQALMEDPRVTLSMVIEHAAMNVTKRLITDVRWGFWANRGVYETYQPKAVTWYLERYTHAVSQAFAMAFFAKQLITWTDLVEPLSDRLKASIGFDEEDDEKRTTKRIKKSL
jgi:hypothetical protein